MEVFYEEEDVTVYWDAGHGRVHVDWRNIPTDRTVHRGCEEMLVLLRQRGCHHVLNDNSNVVGPWNSSAQWVAEEWFPRMLAAGLTKFAWIQSPNSLSKFAARQSTAHNQDTGVIRLFENAQAAGAWLDE